MKRICWISVCCIFLTLNLLSVSTFPVSDDSLRRVVNLPAGISRDDIRQQLEEVVTLSSILGSRSNRAEISNSNLLPAVEIITENKWTWGGQDVQLKSLSADEFEILIENLYQIARLTEQWKVDPHEPLAEYIGSNLTSGFLRFENISSDGEKISFRIGGLIDVEMDIKTLQISNIDGLILAPTYSYFCEINKSFRAEMEDLLMDGEENMGLDCALAHKEAFDELDSRMRGLGSNVIRLQRHGEDIPFEVKLENESEINAVNSDVSGYQYVGDFSSLDEEGSFLNLMNALYYGAFGAHAFGVIDKQMTLEPGCAKKSAEDFYGKLEEMDQFGQLPEDIVVQEWGAGDGCSAAAFLERMKELDNEKGTLYYERVTYILLDYSQTVVENLSNAPHLAAHKGRIEVRQADVLDSGSLTGVEPALLIRANLLLNSLPTKIIEIRNGTAYEVEARTYIDMKEYEVIEGYNLEDIKHAIQTQDIALLQELGKEFFQRIKFIERLSLIEDLSQFGHGRYVQGLLHSGYEGRFSLDVGAAVCLSNMFAHLADSGSIQIADAGFLRDNLAMTARLLRHFGAIYHAVNMDFISQSFPITLDISSQYDYAGDYAPKLVPMRNVMTILSDFSNFKRYFNSQTVGNQNGLENLSGELMRRYGELDAVGLREFIHRGDEVSSLAFYPRKFIDLLEEAGIINSTEATLLYESEVRDGFNQKRIIQLKRTKEDLEARLSGVGSDSETGVGIRSLMETIDREISELTPSGDIQIQDIFNKVLLNLKSLENEEGFRIVENYEDVLLCLLYTQTNINSLSFMQNQRYLTDESGGVDSFQHFLRIMSSTRVLDVIWSDLTFFYPGVKIISIERTSQ
ncbi:MAG: hypothetical protein P9M06_07135 [Candidatus Saelkia tenebricola]|nr:hypothetical protein [Candidatus Saelkia tenebricola]